MIHFVVFIEAVVIVAIDAIRVFIGYFLKTIIHFQVIFGFKRHFGILVKIKIGFA